MAVVVITEPPASVEMYDAVNAKLGRIDPAGLIVHTAGTGDDGKFLIVDVWESREAHDRFGEEQLRPAIAAVMREHGEDPESAPEAKQTFIETHDMIAPALAGAR